MATDEGEISFLGDEIRRKRKQLREMIDAEAHLENAVGCAMVLSAGWERRIIEDVEYEVPLSRDRIAGLKASADISLRLLNKRLPDLKSVELQQGESGDSLTFTMTLNPPNKEK